jgi:hypothetical protein
VGYENIGYMRVGTLYTDAAKNLFLKTFQISDGLFNRCLSKQELLAAIDLLGKNHLPI